jgi:hypothetical protein
MLKENYDRLTLSRSGRLNDINEFITAEFWLWFS